MSFINIFGLGEAVTEVAKTLEVAASGITAMFDVVLSPNMSLEQLAGTYSKKIDELILAEMNKKLDYVGGSFNVEYANESAFQVSYELYFQDENKEWVKKEAKSKPQKMSYLKQEAVAELHKKKKVSFEIDPPSAKREEKKEIVPKKESKENEE